MGEVLVLVDHVDGEVKKVTAELVTAARRLGEPSAVVVGGPGAAGRLAGLVAENAERLAVIETRDSGKVIRKTRGQIAGVPAIYQYFAGAADKIEGRTYAPQTNFFTYSQKRPVGVVAAVLPWNSPVPSREQAGARTRRGLPPSSPSPRSRHPRQRWLSRGWPLRRVSRPACSTW